MGFSERQLQLRQLQGFRFTIALPSLSLLLMNRCTAWDATPKIRFRLTTKDVTRI